MSTFVSMVSLTFTLAFSSYQILSLTLAVFPDCQPPMLQQLKASVSQPFTSVFCLVYHKITVNVPRFIDFCYHAFPEVIKQIWGYNKVFALSRTTFTLIHSLTFLHICVCVCVCVCIYIKRERKLSLKSLLHPICRS